MKSTKNSSIATDFTWEVLRCYGDEQQYKNPKIDMNSSQYKNAF